MSEPKELENPKNLMAGLLEEMNRIRELIKEYEKVGDSGKYACVLLQHAINSAEVAIKENDVVKMLLAYNSLKTCTL